MATTTVTTVALLDSLPLGTVRALVVALLDAMIDAEAGNASGADVVEALTGALDNAGFAFDPGSWASGCCVEGAILDPRGHRILKSSKH